MYRLRDSGLSVLPDRLKAREMQLTGDLGTYQGALAELESQAKLAILIVELGADHLRSIVEEGRNPWCSGDQGDCEPLLKRLGTYMAQATRTVALLATLRGDKGAIDMASGMSAALRGKDKGDE
jgi:hypothetical protein